MMTDTNTVPALRSVHFEEDWGPKKIGEITSKVGSGKTPRGGSEVYTDEGVPFVRSQNVNNNRLDLSDLTFIPIEIDREMANSRVHPNDILLNITGASIGRSCVVPADFQAGNVNQHVCIIRLNPSYDARFLQPFLASSRGQRLIKIGQTGSGREGLNFQSIRSFSVKFPTLPEQEKIADFLTAVDKRIGQLTRKKALLEDYKKGVMQQLFSQAIRFKDEHGNDFPDWEEKKLKTVARIYDGTHSTPVYTKTGVPFYSVEHLTRGSFQKTKFISEEVFEKENKRVKLERGDVLMTRIGDIGTSRHLDWDVRASFYVSLALMKLQRERVSPEFAHQSIASRYFQRELWQRTIHVAFPKKINLGEIGECRITLPTLPEQEKIADFLSAIDRKLEAVGTQITETQTFKRGLLQQMFV